MSAFMIYLTKYVDIYFKINIKSTCSLKILPPYFIKNTIPTFVLFDVCIYDRHILKFSAWLSRALMATSL